MQRTDLTGKSFGRLTVIKYARSIRTKSGGYVMWLCMCSCGNETVVRMSHLTEGRVRSCGCLLAEGNFDNPRGSKAPGVAYLRYVFGYYAKNAKIRRIDFNIEFEDFCAMVAKPCHYCGSPPTQGKNKSRLGRPDVFNGVIKHNGIDRIDSQKGYVSGNMAACCKVCNYAKRKMTAEEFISWAHRLHFNLVSIGA